MTETISQFRDNYRWLSNFHLCKVVHEGLTFASSEHAYQAAKAKYPEDRLKFIVLGMSSVEAKRLGKIIPCRGDWEDVKLDIMLCILRCKFTQNAVLRGALYGTGDAELIEGNSWHDNFWGNCMCGRAACTEPGLNHLGRLLMQVRAELCVS